MERLRAYPWVVATLVVGAVGLGLLAAGDDDASRWVVVAWVVLVAATQAWGMVRSLRAGDVGLDILAVLAISAAVAVGEHWAALVVVVMLTGGEALEDYAERRAQRELTALLDRAPRVAHLVDATGTVADVPVEDVAVGDTLLLKPAEVVPVDGELASDAAVLDESSVTGESLPVEHVRGDRIVSGALNGDRAVHVRATARAADSQYQQIVALVAEAQSSRAPMVRLADRYAVPFTIVAVAIALLAWWVSGDPRRLAEVLVVATPCPLLIAAPVAFVAGMSRSARAGVVVKGGGVLEQLSRVRTVALDKTGTLTHGRPHISRVVATDGISEDDVLALAAATEQYSAHPLATALVAGARARGMAPGPAADVVEETAHGVAATISGRRVAVGRWTWVLGASALSFGTGAPPAAGTASAGADAPASGAAEPDDACTPSPGAVWPDGARTASLSGSGAAATADVRTPVPSGPRAAEPDDVPPGTVVVHVAIDGRRVGRVELKDTVRDESAAVLAALRGVGVEHVVMLTGDREATALHVAAEVGVDEVRAALLPQEKVAAVAALPDRPVLMVGDGVNDAPVLAVADVGVAMGATGATAASESADAVLLVDNLGALVRLIGISRRTVRVALESIWAGIGLSVVLMLVAAFGLLPALAGAAMQEVVDLVAILGALRALTPGRGEPRFPPRPRVPSPSAKTPVPV
ncbi:HAD-IC family P-type ATPase [Sanguibacter sp. HDW7]|uniref:HAD-IC family P-type ATPase n=1 Tax=Sanguibacter sp. HDW7 TaxID=2714931 RepID=UPI00140C8369|nr:HAD-IC family P-type ATPase [Sanguibacter sp. HDW7]QIK82311.1 HAD-IC family P-type ATPase [Sanguibacter sp. HDW7]